MKTTLKWAALIIGGTAGLALFVSWLDQTRRGIARGLERAETVANETRATLAQAEHAIGETETTLRSARDTIA